MGKLLPVDDALAAILKDAGPVDSEPVLLNEACGRVLAEDLIATRTQPPFETTAMDGYAVRFDDVGSVPCHMKIIGESAAGKRFDGTLNKGQAVRIFTGAPMPKGADAIVIQENTESDGKHVTILQSPRARQFIRPRGLDFNKGDLLLQEGLMLTPAALALVASANHPTPLCLTRPLVALISTGNELVAPGTLPGLDEIISSNSYGVGAQIRQFGGEVLDIGIISDDMERLVGALEQAEMAGADIIVTLGGASVGDHDLTGPAMKKIGVDVDFWKIAMRPGKPLMFGRKGQNGKTLRYFGLPGNPVSSLVCSKIFIEPLIKTMLCQNSDAPQLMAILSADLSENDQRQEYMRAVVEPSKEHGFIATPFDKQDSSMVWNAARANALLIRRPFAPAIASGDPCPFIWF